VASTPSSSHTSAPGGAYYLYGGPIPSTTLTPSSTGFSGPSASTGIPGAYALPSAIAAHHGDVVIGTVSIDSFDAFILFDSGASFSFVSKAFVDRTGISIQKIGQPIIVNSAKGPISSNYVCPGCVVHLADEDFVANLVVIPLDVFDSILGMDWLSQYQAIISCFMKTISLYAPSGGDVIFVGSAMKYSFSLLYHLFPDHWTRKSGILFSMVQDGEAVLHVEDIRVVCNYPDVFPLELPGIPPTRNAVFEIKLVPITQPIYKSPYWMAPKEQVELKWEQDDLLAKGFIRPSKSP
jgi:hypothetical protein